MHILLVAATEFEIAPTLKSLTTSQKSFPVDVRILITGVGIPAASYAITKAIGSSPPPAFVIQAGIAGTFGNRPALVETVLVEKDAFGDLGMEEKNDFTTLFDAGFADKNKSPFTHGWLENNHPFLKLSPMQKVAGITVNKISDSIIQRQQLVSAFSPAIETMEGAALHYVCGCENIPFLQLRSISNQVGDRLKSNWKTRGAIENLNGSLKHLLYQADDLISGPFKTQVI